jgi:AraC-like DNA-binding protein
MMRSGGQEQALRLAGSRRESLLLTSAAAPWVGVPFELHAMGPLREAGESGPLDGEYGLMVIVAGAAELVTRSRGRDVPIGLRPGSVSILSGQQRRYVVRMDGQATAACFNLTRHWFARLGFAEPPSEFASTKALGVEPSLAVLSYVFERLSARASGERVRGKLSPRQCRRLQLHVRERLGEDLSLSELASFVGMSPRHFSTLFRAAFGVSPHRYLLQLRLAEGARLLSAGESDIARVALELGFCSHSHFSTAFRKQFGAPPRRYLSELLHGR